MTNNIQMEIIINLQNDTVTINGISKPLDHLRSWLLLNYPDLCTKSFIKAIQTSKGTLFTYDWDYIFFVAKNPIISENYFNSL